jgi:hypothetical protein
MLYGFIEINDIEKCIELIKYLKEKQIKLKDNKLLNSLNIKISDLFIQNE